MSNKIEIDFQANPFLNGVAETGIKNSNHKNAELTFYNEIPFFKILSLFDEILEKSEKFEISF